MKEEILKCKRENPTFGYKKIAKLVNCSHSLVSYYLNPKTKQRHDENQKTYRRNINHILKRKKDNFQCVNGNRKSKGKRTLSLFSSKDLKEKLVANPKCYLTGKPINLSDPKSYNLDHIIPVAKQGDCSLENC